MSVPDWKLASTPSGLHPGWSGDQLVMVAEGGPISLRQSMAGVWSREKPTSRMKTDSQNGAVRGLSRCGWYGAMPKSLPGHQAGTQAVWPLGTRC